jgi:hypothetical protein
MSSVVPLAQAKIIEVREMRVMLDSDLAGLYGVETRVLLQQVRRNRGRFPDDFMFQLSDAEWKVLRSQFVISKAGRGGRRSKPFAFTEHGVAMLSSVLRSEQAITVNIEIMRAFVAMRYGVHDLGEIAKRLDQLERLAHSKLNVHDKQLVEILAVLRGLTAVPTKRRRPVGFRVRDDKE